VPDNKLLGALFAMLANIIATVPTIRHAWAAPREETWQLFAANTFASGLGCAGIILVGGFEIVSTAGPLIAMLGNLSLVLITIGRRWLVMAEREIINDVERVEEAFVASLKEVDKDSI
jgi:hypothetical protein